MKTPLHLQVSLALSSPPYQLWFLSSMSFIQNMIDKKEEADTKVDWMKRVIKVQAGDINYLTWVKNNWQSQWTFNERLAMPVVLLGWTGFRWCDVKWILYRERSQSVIITKVWLLLLCRLHSTAHIRLAPSSWTELHCRAAPSDLDLLRGREIPRYCRFERF